MICKLFRLWHEHTVGFVRAITVLIIPACIIEELGTLYCCGLIILDMIVRTGYAQKWEDNDAR